MKNQIAKPFLKWAGGKTQLLNKIESLLPKEIYNSEFTYVEPFVGSGAVLFWMLKNFPNIKKAIINDVNKDLINTYQVIASRPKELISILKTLEGEYHSLETQEVKKKEYYYSKRELYNTRQENKEVQAALFIFLNRTCFNGLYRVNKNNGYNASIGSYKNPMICDEANILTVCEALKKVQILCGDYHKTLDEVDGSSFFYLDPPYKPLNKTSNFNSYAKEIFNDEEQIRLRDFCTLLDTKGTNWMLSNSDVKNTKFENTFFDDIYSDFYIYRVQAKRKINTNTEKRGGINELLIINYKMNHMTIEEKAAIYLREKCGLSPTDMQKAKLI